MVSGTHRRYAGTGSLPESAAAAGDAAPRSCHPPPAPPYAPLRKDRVVESGEESRPPIPPPDRIGARLWFGSDPFPGSDPCSEKGSLLSIRSDPILTSDPPCCQLSSPFEHRKVNNENTKHPVLEIIPATDANIPQVLSTPPFPMDAEANSFKVFAGNGPSYKCQKYLTRKPPSS